MQLQELGGLVVYSADKPTLLTLASKPERTRDWHSNNRTVPGTVIMWSVSSNTLTIYDVNTWKPFLHHWPFVKAIHWLCWILFTKGQYSNEKYKMYFYHLYIHTAIKSMTTWISQFNYVFCEHKYVQDIYPTPTPPHPRHLVAYPCYAKV